MVGSVAAAHRTLPTCHSFAVLLLLSEMTAEAFTGTGGPTGNRHQKHELKHECSAAEVARDHRRRALLPLAPLGAMSQDEDVWWEGDVDPWTEAASRALMQQFKDSVLDEDGLSVRAMSDESARELAGQTADGILDLVEREFRSRLPPPSSPADFFESEDPPVTAATESTAANSGTDASVGECEPLLPLAMSPRSSHLAEQKGGGEGGFHQEAGGNGEEGEEEEEEEEEEEDGGLDWGDGADRRGKRKVTIGGGRGDSSGTETVVPGGVYEPGGGLEALQDDAEYESTLTALKAYHNQHGNLLLTQKYVMPVADDDSRDRGRAGGGGGGAPQMVEHRGWRLGQKAYNMKFWKKHVRGRPSRRQELAALGFVWGRLQDEYNLFVEALLAYKDIEGSLLVPTSFVVPDTAPWPLCCQGMRLGVKVSGVRNQSLYVRSDVARWYQLDAMGFVWDLSDAPFRQVYDALLQYKALHGNLHVPVAFCVPSTAPWQEDLWGLALGQRVLDIRARHRYIRNDPQRIRLLNEAGFRWADAAKASYGNVVRALKAYRKIKGRDFSVPSSFVVPSFLPWPQSCWGLRLGTALVDIRSKGRYLKGIERRQRRVELERLGVFAQSREAILANVVKGLRCYLSVFGDTMVPQGFVVPDGEAWPQECRGQRLGSMLYGLRRRPERLDRHPGVRAELTALGFSWQVPKKGPKGPRKRKTLAPASAAVTGVGGGGVEASGGGGVNGGGVYCETGSGGVRVAVNADYPSVGVAVATDEGLRVRRTERLDAGDGGARVSAAGVAAAAAAAAGPAAGVGGVCSCRAPGSPKDGSRRRSSRSSTDLKRSSGSTSSSSGSGGSSRGEGSGGGRSSNSESRSSSLLRTRKEKAGRLLSPTARWLLEEGGAMVGGGGGQAGGAAGAGALPGAPR